jgi:hypothetical protein
MITYNEVHEWMALANLMIFVIILSLLIGLSFFLQKRRNFVWHGNVMLVVVMIAGLLTVAHMAPSLWWMVVKALGGLDIITLTGIIHGIVGFIALSLGVWLVGTWAYVKSEETRFCAPKRKLMRRILILWTITLTLGLIYYPMHLILG